MSNFLGQHQPHGASTVTRGNSKRHYDIGNRVLPGELCHKATSRGEPTSLLHVLLSWQIIALFLIAIPIASVTWTATHEEVFREPRDYCVRQSETSRSPVRRKFFYLFTCEYCFSHYVTIIFLIITRYKLLYTDWRGYLIGGLSLVWVANQYMSLFGRLRLDIKRERVEIKEVEQQVAEPKSEPKKMPRAI